MSPLHRTARRALVGTLDGPSRTFTVEPVRVPRAPRVVPAVPREPAPKPAPAKPEREPVPAR